MIGKRVKQLRIEKGLTLSTLASRAGVAKSYLSSLERDLQSNPSIHFLEKIASVLEIPVDFLFHDTPKETLDQGWYELAREAMESGISKDQFREFLDFSKWRSIKKD